LRGPTIHLPVCEVNSLFITVRALAITRFLVAFPAFRAWFFRKTLVSFLMPIINRFPTVAAPIEFLRAKYTSAMRLRPSAPQIYTLRIYRRKRTVHAVGIP